MSKRSFISLSSIEENDYSSKEMPLQYILDSCSLNEQTRVAKIKFTSVKKYRTISRYITRNYEKFPIYSEWKTKYATINKTIKLSNQALESLRFRVLENDENIYKRLRGFSTKKEAENAYKSFMEDFNAKKDPNFKLLYDTLVNEYLSADKSHTKDSTHYDKLSIFKLYITPFFAGRNVADLKKSDFYNFQEELFGKQGKTDKPLSTKYINKIRGFLNHFLDWCFQKYDVINVLKAVAKSKNKVAKQEMQIWEAKDFQPFLNQIEDLTWKTFFTLMFFTGMRVGECKALGDTDLLIFQSAVSVTKTYSRKTTDGSLFKITATKNSQIRVTPFPNTILPQLNDYLQWKHKNNIAPQFLFGGDKPLNESTIARAWKSYIALAKMKPIRIHDIRHSYVSMLVNLNVNTKTIAALIGDTEEQVIKTYSHLYADAKNDAVNKINALFTL